MIEWSIIIFLTIGWVVSYNIIKKRAYRKGMQDLLSLFLVNGYESKVKAFITQNKFIQPGGTVFVGDSITQDYNVYEYFYPHHVYNRGIGGDTTSGLLHRLNESIFDLMPKQILLQIGTNDFGVLNDDPENICNRMKQIVTEIKEKLPDAVIYLMSVYPVNETIDPMTVGFRTNHKIDLLNRLNQQVEDVIYLDVASILKDPLGRLDKTLSVEGLHINAKGYQIITEYIKTHINL